jgi:hypothetical protein
VRSAVLAPIGQVAVMAAIVATLAYFPLGFIVGLMLRVFGVSFTAFVTFGAAVAPLIGLLLWWLLLFAGACIYAACLFPWGDEVLGWPRKK